MAKSKLQTASENEIEELQDLMGRLHDQLSDYSHVWHIIPKPLFDAIDNFHNKINEEKQKREDE